MCNPHAMTGCDMTSFFHGKKKTARDVWNIYNSATQAFRQMALTPCELNDGLMETLERFVILLYDKTSDQDCVNAPREDMFYRKGRQINNIWSRAALFKHCKKVMYQGGFIWDT